MITIIKKTWQKKVSFLSATVGAKKRNVSGISMMKVERTLSLWTQAGGRLAANHARGVGKH